MLSDNLKQQIRRDNERFRAAEYLGAPEYDPRRHVTDLTKSPYYRALIVLRHYLKAATDYYFGEVLGAKNVDLFMLTPSISSPMGPGSDSEGVEILFGNLTTNLVDSSQFGFEPLLINGFEKLYCYLPSMRGENPDKRHLNQFYHCEAEFSGTLQENMPAFENYVRVLASAMLEMPFIINCLSKNRESSLKMLAALAECDPFPSITFDEAVAELEKANCHQYVHYTPHGRDISAEGEIKLAELLDFKTPFWVIGFDRNRVPFYQQPSADNPKKVLAADLVFPPILPNSFGGEIVGSGQRQDSAESMLESLRRQGVDPEPYEWYVQLRNHEKYRTTSGFGLGIERFITWAICEDDIKKAIPYPRIKNLKTYP